MTERNFNLIPVSLLDLMIHLLNLVVHPLNIPPHPLNSPLSKREVC
jgi:hypothetical protein